MVDDPEKQPALIFIPVEGETDEVLFLSPYGAGSVEFLKKGVIHPDFLSQVQVESVDGTTITVVRVQGEVSAVLLPYDVTVETMLKVLPEYLEQPVEISEGINFGDFGDEEFDPGDQE